MGREMDNIVHLPVRVLPEGFFLRVFLLYFFLLFEDRMIDFYYRNHFGICRNFVGILHTGRVLVLLHQMINTLVLISYLFLQIGYQILEFLDYRFLLFGVVGRRHLEEILERELEFHFLDYAAHRRDFALELDIVSVLREIGRVRGDVDRC